MAVTDYKPVARSSNGTPLYECVCPDCGAIRIQDKRKIGKPCHPCAMKRRVTHGKSNTKIYRVWNGMIARCTYPSATHYKYYGGRGIDVCPEWRQSPAVFFEWAYKNGYREGLEIDRREPDGDYSPENCRFITHMENSQLSRSTRCSREQAESVKHMLDSGESIKSTAKAIGVTYMTVWHISKGNTWHNA